MYNKYSIIIIIALGITSSSTDGGKLSGSNEQKGKRVFAFYFIIILFCFSSTAIYISRKVVTDEYSYVQHSLFSYFSFALQKLIF